MSAVIEGLYQTFLKLLDLLTSYYKIWRVPPTKRKDFRCTGESNSGSFFDTLQKLLTEVTVLAHANFKAPFILHTDASGKGLGIVLYQNQEGK